MTENPSVPGPRRDLAMHNDWWASGWDHILPRQSFPLTMLIGTASQGLSRYRRLVRRRVCETARLALLSRRHERASLNPNLICWFCYQVIDLDQDGAATKLRLGAVDPVRGGVMRQQVYSHSDCLREQVHPNIDLWFEL
ncbi:hypothetical protein OHA46_00030 [Streptomyces sp. NBC_00708]